MADIPFLLFLRVRALYEISKLKGFWGNFFLYSVGEILARTTIMVGVKETSPKSAELMLL